MEQVNTINKKSILQ